MKVNSKEKNTPPEHKATTHTTVVQFAKSESDKDIFGLIIFIFLFFTAALGLYRARLYNILEVYLPNIDLIANILTWVQGPYDMWKNLYISSTNTFTQLISQTTINYLSLLGLTYVVAREAKLTKNTLKGWSFAFVMLLCTYLLPSNVATWIMDMVYKKSKSISFTDNFAGVISTIVGVIVTLIFLFTEIIVLKRYRDHLSTFPKNIHSIPKKLNL